MNSFFKPFIGIYHIVSKILSLPKNIFNNNSNSNVANQINTATTTSNNANSNINNNISNGNFYGIKRKVSKEVRPLISFRYYVIDKNKKKSTGLFDAENESDVRGFLESQGYTVLKILEKKPYDIEIGSGKTIKIENLAFSLTQLSTYIKAGIPLVDSVRILAKQAHRVDEKRAYERLVYDLLKGENLSDAMLTQDKKFPKLLINMIKTAEMTGDLPTVLDDMADYYTSIEQTRKQMVSAMTYPVVVMLLALGVLVFMLIYLVPQFVNMFESQDATLPAITLFIMSVSDFIKLNYLWIITGTLAVVIGFKYLYSNMDVFRSVVQRIIMHLPVFGNIIIYNEVANFTKTFASLLNHGVFITDSMEVLSKITNNEIYKGIINKTLNNLSKGESISKAFENKWAFPVVAYEMLVTGEKTGQLGLMMEKVADHFQNLHKTLINQLKSLVEPLMIIVLAIIVGVILLSIIIPMFDIYGKIQ